MLLFAPLFSKRIWQGFRAGYGCNFSTWETNGECDFAGDGLHEQPHFQNYYRVLSRAVWSSRKASQILLRHLIVVFAPTGVLVMGLMIRLSVAEGSELPPRDLS